MAGQLWGVNTLGGYMFSEELSDILRTQVQPLCKFRQFSDAKDFTDKGLQRGQFFSWNVYSDVATAGGQLVETSVMSETNFTVTQGTGTVYEYGNSVPFTAMLDAMSKHPVQDIINKTLRHDCVKVLDTAAFVQFDSTPMHIVPTGGTDASSVTVIDTSTATDTTVNNVALGKNHVKSIVDAMKERNVPVYAGDEYMCIARPTTLRPLKNDLEGVYQYQVEGFGMIYNGEVGKFEGVRFIEQTNVPSGNRNATTGAFTPWKNGNDWAFFFGEDTVAEALVIPEEMRGKIPTDYGRGKGIAWYYLGGFAITQATASNARIFKWSSAS